MYINFKLKINKHNLVGIKVWAPKIKSYTSKMLLFIFTFCWRQTLCQWSLCP